MSVCTSRHVCENAARDWEVVALVMAGTRVWLTRFGLLVLSLLSSFAPHAHSSLAPRLHGAFSGIERVDDELTAAEVEAVRIMWQLLAHQHLEGSTFLHGLEEALRLRAEQPAGA